MPKMTPGPIISGPPPMPPEVIDRVAKAMAPELFASQDQNAWTHKVLRRDDWRKLAVSAIWSTLQAVEEGALDGQIHW